VRQAASLKQKVLSMHPKLCFTAPNVIKALEFVMLTLQEQKVVSAQNAAKAFN
jgi:hypothetical protein